MLDQLNGVINAGIWNSILLLVVAGLLGGVLIKLLKGKTSVFAMIFTTILGLGPNICMSFYIWHIRHGIGWLIFAVILAILVVINAIGALHGAKIRNQQD